MEQDTEKGGPNPILSFVFFLYKDFCTLFIHFSVERTRLNTFFNFKSLKIKIKSKREYINK